MTKQKHVSPVFPCGVDGPLRVVFHAPGVAVHHQDPLASQLDELLRLVRVAVVAVAGHGGHGNGGKLAGQPVRVVDTVTQMQNMVRLRALHAHGHVVHPPVGVGQNENSHKSLLPLKKIVVRL